MRALGIDPVHDTRRVFRALCEAASRPGTVQSLPVTPGDHAVVSTLVDAEVAVHTRDQAVQDALASAGRYDPAGPTKADLLHVRGSPAWDVREVERGSLVEPSDGATVLYDVETIASDTSGGTTEITVSGPGVPESRTVGIGLPAGDLEALAAAQSTYPRGVDAYVVAGDRVVALPRSISLEVH